jgi:hypothetical protein
LLEEVISLIVGALLLNKKLNFKFLVCYKFFAMNFDTKFDEEKKLELLVFDLQKFEIFTKTNTITQCVNGKP